MRSNKKEHRKKVSYLEQCSLFPLKRLTLQRTILYKIIQNKNGEEGSRINIRAVQQILGVYHKISIHGGMSATGVNCYLSETSHLEECPAVSLKMPTAGILSSLSAVPYL